MTGCSKHTMMIPFFDQTCLFRLNLLNTRSVQDTVDLIGTLSLNVVHINPPNDNLKTKATVLPPIVVTILYVS